MSRYVIIVAGGKGLRMGAEIPKQFLPIGGMPVLMRTMQAFHDACPDMRQTLVLPAGQMDYWSRLCADFRFAVPHRLAAGGDTRFHSVKNGLALIDDPDDTALVGVHDGVRPFVSPTVIDRCYRVAAARGAAVPVLPPVETLRRMGDNGSSVTVARGDYRMVQTPQVFRLGLLRRAYGQPFSPAFTDDASVVEALGMEICLVEGNRENVKITTPFDLKVAEALLSGG